MAPHCVVLPRGLGPAPPCRELFSIYCWDRVTATSTPYDDVGPPPTFFRAGAEESLVGERLDDARAVAEHLLEELGLELVDLEMVGSGGARVLRVSVDRAGGVDLDAIAAASEALSPLLDRLDPISGRYVLEVSSPGVERPLRRPVDFARHLGALVSVRTHDLADGAHRHRGVLRTADEGSFEVEIEEGDRRSFRYDEVAQVRTIFEWGPEPRPTGRRNAGARRGAAAREPEGVRR